MGLFAALFVVPEVLWSSTVNVVSSLFETGVTNSWALSVYNNELLLKTIVAIQFIGTVLFIVALIKSCKEVGRFLFYLSLLLSIVCLLVSAFAMYLLFIFNPSFF